MKIKRILALFSLLVAVLLLAALSRPQPIAAGDHHIFLPQIANHYPLIVLSGNLLPNPSFEEGWYHPNGVPELQIPNQWRFLWEEGENPFDDAPWSDWVRPEVRVMPDYLLPPEEQPLFIWDREYTVKIFKFSGSISFELETDVWLEPGMYLFEVSVYPDLVDHYENNEKVFAPDPLSGEFRFIVGDKLYNWWLPAFGEKNTMWKLFTVDEAGWVTVGAAMRGRWALLNNGWFMDDWRLVRVGGG